MSTLGDCAQVDEWAGIRRRLGLTDKSRGDPVLEQAASAVAPAASQLHNFVQAAAYRYRRKTIDPGQPCSVLMQRHLFPAVSATRGLAV